MLENREEIPLEAAIKLLPCSWEIPYLEQCSARLVFRLGRELICFFPVHLLLVLIQFGFWANVAVISWGSFMVVLWEKKMYSSHPKHPDTGCTGAIREETRRFMLSGKLINGVCCDLAVETWVKELALAPEYQEYIRRFDSSDGRKWCRRDDLSWLDSLSRTSYAANSNWFKFWGDGKQPRLPLVTTSFLPRCAFFHAAPCIFWILPSYPGGKIASIICYHCRNMAINAFNTVALLSGSTPR